MKQYKQMQKQISNLNQVWNKSIPMEVLPPKVISYCIEILKILKMIGWNENPDLFFNICHKVLNKYAPGKKKYIRGNNKPTMTKALSKAVMDRTRLRNKFLKNPTNQNRLSYTKQRNFCLSLLRKEKKEHFANLNEMDITDNRKFW